jgi:ABC-type glycerol-3-phosphate transport system substrate-binding protein
MSPKKLILIAVAVITLLSLIIGFFYLKSSSKKSSWNPTGVVSVWVVGDDSAGFWPLITEFKKQPGNKELDVVVTKFASYKEYEQTLVNVIADGKSPDVFVVPSTGSALLESKVQSISELFYDGTDLSKNLPKLFDSLVLIEPGINEAWKKVDFRSLKWAPMGYETMAMYYDRTVLNTAPPSSWSEFESLFLQGDMAATPAVLGFGSRYIPQAPNIVSLFLVQNGVNSAANLKNGQAQAALDAYRSYVHEDTSIVPTALFNQKTELDANNIHAIDLFVQGKTGVIFGYPSILREIDYSIKRAGSSNELDSKDLLAVPVPQLDDGKPVNLARFSYFAVSKYSQNMEAAARFVGFLTTPTAWELYAESFPQYLPARLDVLDARKEAMPSKSFPRVRYESYFPAQGVELVNFDRGLTSEFEDAVNAWLQSTGSSSNILAEIQSRIECRVLQLRDGKAYDTSCESGVKSE